MSLASMFADPLAAQKSQALLLFPTIVWSGIYVSISQLPSWLRWPAWISPLFPTMRLLIEEEFRFCLDREAPINELPECVTQGVLKTCSSEEALFTSQSIQEASAYQDAYAQCRAYLEDIGATEERRALYWFATFACFIGYRLVGIFFRHIHAR